VQQTVTTANVIKGSDIAREVDEVSLEGINRHLALLPKVIGKT